MHPLMEDNRDAIEVLCREFGIACLEVFGSIVNGEFDPERSDVDFIAEYPEGYDFGIWLSRYFELEDRLEGVLGRPVDVLIPSALKNRWFRREANTTRMELFNASKIAEGA